MSKYPFVSSRDIFRCQENRRVSEPASVLVGIAMNRTGRGGSIGKSLHALTM